MFLNIRLAFGGRHSNPRLCIGLEIQSSRGRTRKVLGFSGKIPGIRVRLLVQVLALPLPSCVILSKLLALSEPQISPKQLLSYCDIWVTSSKVARSSHQYAVRSPCSLPS